MGKTPMAEQLLVGQGLLIIETSQSNTDTPHLVGILWTSDQPDAETCTRQQTELTRDNHAPGGIRTRNPNRRATEDPRFGPRGQRDREDFVHK